MMYRVFRILRSCKRTLMLKNERRSHARRQLSNRVCAGRKPKQKAVYEPSKMAKATTIKDAIKKWEEKHPDQDIAAATEVGFQFQWPPIEKMDNSLSVLVNCSKLSLSTNMIEKIAGLGGLKNLKVLSLGRNYIKNFSGLEPLADTLEELWISYNFIEKIKGIGVLKKLKVLYMSNNLVKEWGEFNKLQELPLLEDLLFIGNPLYENMEETVWRTQATNRLSNLKKLDGETVLRDEVEDDDD